MTPAAAELPFAALPEAPTCPPRPGSAEARDLAPIEPSPVATAPEGPRFRLRVLRVKCLDCAENRAAVRACDNADLEEPCPLNPYRMGKRPPKGTAKYTPLRALRAYCRWCCLDQPREVRLCPAVGCPLWPWRRGRAVGEARDRGVVPSARTGAESRPAAAESAHVQRDRAGVGEGAGR